MESCYTFHLAIDFWERMLLSLASNRQLKRKNPTLKQSPAEGRSTVEEHLSHLVQSCKEHGNPIAPTAPLVALSCRNVLANLRCGAWIKGRTTGFLTVIEEESARARRPYHALGLKNGRLVIEEFIPRPDTLNSFEWLVTGVPVWWDGEPVFQRILTEAADPSHVFHLPRGHHPLATKETISRWQRLHRRFLDLVNSPLDEAFREMRKSALGLKRENNYLHNVVGVTADGRLRVLVGNGRLERLGKRIAECGVKRAIVVDNGGSTSVFYFPRGFRHRAIQLVAAPNYRPMGTALLIVVRPDQVSRSNLE